MRAGHPRYPLYLGQVGHKPDGFEDVAKKVHILHKKSKYDFDQIH